MEEENNGKKIHIWHIIIVIIAAILFILIAIFISKGTKHTLIPIQVPTTTKEFISSDNSFSMKINSNYNMKKASLENYVLNLYTDDNFFLYVSCIEKHNFDLTKIIESDKKIFVQELENYTILTDITEVSYNNISGYSYSLSFTKNNSFYILYEFITVINDKVYFFDIEFPEENANLHFYLADELLKSISLI